MSLNPETLEALVCLRSWYRAWLVEEKDDHEFIHDIENEMNIEDIAGSFDFKHSRHCMSTI